MKRFFIAGSIQLDGLKSQIIMKLNEIIKNNFEIIVGDAKGVDKAVQQYLYNKKYNNVKIYATNGAVRNNVGNWEVVSVKSELKIKNRDFFTVKDIQMSKDADIGLMIWDKKSQGTLRNAINLLMEDKEVDIFVYEEDKMYILKKILELEKLVQNCDTELQGKYKELLKKINKKNTENNVKVENKQLSLI